MSPVEVFPPSIPPHVPPELVVDFDFVHPKGAERDLFLALKRLHEGPDIFWTPRYGGHWVVTRGDDIRRILSDYETFSSEAVFIPRRERPRIVPLEVDPPEHMAYRKLIAPAFTPKAIAQWTDLARTLAIELIDGFYARGECEFMSEFAFQLPIIIFMKMCDLPLEDRPQLLRWVGMNIRPEKPGDEQESFRHMNEYIRNLMAQRRSQPGDDLVSQILHSEVFGRPLNDDEAFGLINGLLGGGLDTVASTMGWIARFLAQSPQHRRQLIEEPDLLWNAIEELLRRFSVPNIARVVAKDTVYKGVFMKKGEQVLLSACLHAMDEACFERPLDVDFRRRNARNHSTFSQGPHRCPGATLAVAELKIFLEEWLRRIPDFWIRPGECVETATGIVHGVKYLPLVWDPQASTS